MSVSVSLRDWQAGVSPRVRSIADHSKVSDAMGDRHLFRERPHKGSGGYTHAEPDLSCLPFDSSRMTGHLRGTPQAEEKCQDRVRKVQRIRRIRGLRPTSRWRRGGARCLLIDVRVPGSALKLLLVPLLTAHVSWPRALQAVCGTGLVAALVLGFQKGRTAPLGRLGPSQRDPL